jgi:predicted outer membrane lipoprotein
MKMEYLTVTSTTSNAREFASWFFSCLLALALIAAAFSVMYPAAAEPVEDQVKGVVESYYRAALADDPAMYNGFTNDAMFKFSMDFGGAMPNYEVEFRADETEAFDSSIFEGFEVISANFEVEAVEMTDTGAIVHGMFRQTYRWSGYEGTMTANEQFTVQAMDNSYFITRYESKQEYR